MQFEHAVLFFHVFRISENAAIKERRQQIAGFQIAGFSGAGAIESVIRNSSGDISVFPMCA